MCREAQNHPLCRLSSSLLARSSHSLPDPEIILYFCQERLDQIILEVPSNLVSYDSMIHGQETSGTGCGTKGSCKSHCTRWLLQGRNTQGYRTSLVWPDLNKHCKCLCFTSAHTERWLCLFHCWCAFVTFSVHHRLCVGTGRQERFFYWGVY